MNFLSRFYSKAYGHLVEEVPPDMTARERDVLEALHEDPRPRRDVQEKFGLSTSHTNRIIRGLRDRGWVKKHSEVYSAPDLPRERRLRIGNFIFDLAVILAIGSAFMDSYVLMAVSFVLMMAYVLYERA